MNRYITFSETKTGADGHEYIQGVKYGLCEETVNTFSLRGKNEKYNIFQKSDIEGLYETGIIINDSYKEREEY